MATKQLKPMVIQLVVFASYFAFARLGLALDPTSGFATLIWAPSGISVAAFIMRGGSVTPAIFLAAFFANYLQGAPVYLACIIAIGNTAEGRLAAYLLARISSGTYSLTGVRNVLYLVIFGALTSPIISASLGVISLGLAGLVQADLFYQTWWSWWLGDAVGICIISPLILAWSTIAVKRWSFTIARQLECALLLIVFLSTVYLLQMNLSNDSIVTPRLYFIFPILFWAAIRFTFWGSTTLTFLLALIMISTTYYGRGRFYTTPVSHGIIQLQLFLAISSISSLLGAALVQEKVREQKRFKAAFDSAPNPLILVNARGEILLVNREAENLFGYNQAELIGQSIDILVPERIRKEHSFFRQSFVSSPARRAMGEGRDLFALHKNNHEIPVEIGLNPLQVQGEGLYVMTSIIDISERKRIEGDLRTRGYELERANRDLEQFAQVASHDLKEPLRTIGKFVELLEVDMRKSWSTREYQLADSIKSGVARMQRIIDDLLTYSKVESRNAPIEIVDCNQALTLVLQSLATLISDSKAKTQIGKLPKIRANLSMIVLVFQNLLSNAIKFSGPHTPEVHVDCEATDDKWIISIKDNGIGFAKRDSEKIFNEFERLHDIKSYPGTGIGLSVVKRVLQRYGGEIRVESKIGLGSTFYLTFPQIEKVEVTTKSANIANS